MYKNVHCDLCKGDFIVKEHATRKHTDWNCPYCTGIIRDLPRETNSIKARVEAVYHELGDILSEFI